MKILIIGGSAGGAGVAARLRRLDETAQIILFEKSETVSFANCGIPYYLGGVIKERERLNVIDLEEYSTILNTEVRTLSEVVHIDCDYRTIQVKDYRTGNVYQERYDKLVIAPGGRVILPSFKGDDAGNTFTIRNAYDTDTIKSYISTKQCKNALIIGAGYIGMEMADNLHGLGMDVTIVDRADQVMGTLDIEMSKIVYQHLLSKKVRVLLNDEVTLVNKFSVTLKSGKNIFADVIIFALGIKPDVSLAQECGLVIGDNGGISVNNGMVTSDENIYALGDAVEVKNTITNNKGLVSLAGIAHKQARIVAENIAGQHKSFINAHLTAIAKVFDKTVAMTGSTEYELKMHSIGYKKSYIEAPSRAGYYPGAFLMTIKLLFAANTGRILGAQIVGTDGVDKRIDVIATAINSGMTVSDLMWLDLAYAPPYSSAKDPVNIAGMVAHNMLHEEYSAIHWDELELYDPINTDYIDVRSKEEFEIGSIKNAINIPVTELRERLDEVKKNKWIILFCNYGKQGYFAYKILSQNGYNNIYNLSGGLRLYNYATNSTDEIEDKEQFHAANNSDINIPALPDSLLELADKPRKQAHNHVIEINACGLNCPGPIMKLSKAMRTAEVGDNIKITATDTGFSTDVKTWCNKKGHKLLEFDDSQKTILAVLEKGK